jgi:hypothetical protein
VHARNTYFDAIIHAYEPNPSMKQFPKHQSGTGGFTYFLKAIGNNDDMVFLDRGGGVSPHKVPFSNRAGTSLRWCSICILRLGGSVDLLKLDCEGAEWSILTDTESLAAVRSLVMEYDLVDGHTEVELISIVRTLGFRVVRQTLTGPTWGLLWATR